jgi:hypothetical protein
MTRPWGGSFGPVLVPSKDLVARLLQFLQQRQLELLGVRNAAQSREFRRHPAELLNEALIFAIEEETDLPERFEIALVAQLHHSPRI